jgi:hypothetical protein
VKRVYLDQNKWIDLGGAHHGRPSGAVFADTARVLEAGRELGELSLPLSAVHYMETAIRRNYESRARLAETMIYFSRLDTIASTEDLIPPEIDRALSEIFGRPANPRPPQPFGRGVQHAFGHTEPLYTLPDELAHLVEDRVTFERDASEEMERFALIGPTPEQERQIEDYEPRSHLPIGERYAQAQEDLRKRRQAAGWHQGERAERLASAQAYSDYLDQINDRATKAGIDPVAIFESGADQATRFLESVPTMFATSELERIRANASVKPWERQDLNDISALSVAAVYCDVVVTERTWVDAARRAGFAERFGTIFLSRLEDLPETLV